VLSPAAEAALRNLRDTDFATREQALTTLQRALAEQVAGMLRGGDPEAESRLMGLLEFESGVLRWAMELLKQPPARREELLAFGLRPDVLPSLARLYADRPATRRDGVRGMAKVEGPLATDLLAARVGDLDRGVYVAAMEALWDRPPTDASVEALWQRAVAAGIAVYNRGPAVRGEPITFRGRVIGEDLATDNSLYKASQDHALACDVLLHLNAPQVPGKVLAMLGQIEAAYGNATDAAGGRVGAGGAVGTNVWMYAGTQEPIKNLARLARAAKPREAFPILYRIATGPVVQKSQGQVNGAKYCWTNRTWAMGLLLEMADRSPTEVKLTRQPLMGGMWTTANETEEEAAVAELKKWWGENAEKSLGKSTTYRGL
jgi:hypothetical protein